MGSLFSAYGITGTDILQILEFMWAVLATVVASWLIPDLLQNILRDRWGLEMNFNTDEQRDLLRKMHIRNFKRTLSGRSDVRPIVENDIETAIPAEDLYVANKFRTHYHGWRGYFRSNFFMVIYFAIRMFIFSLGIYLSFQIIEQDIMAVVGSLGIGFFVAALQLGDYFKNAFAYLYIIFTGKVKKGDLLSFDNGATWEQLAEFNLLHSVLIGIDLNHNWQETIQRQFIKNNKASWNSQGHIPIYPDGTDGTEDKIYTPDINANIQALYSTTAPMSGMSQQFTLLQTMQTQTPGVYGPNTANSVPTTTTFRRPASNIKLHHTDHFIQGQMHESKEHHKIYDNEFIESHIPNIMLVFGTVKIKHH